MIDKKQILNILFWILLIIGVILIFWRIFGDSPTDLSIILTFTLMLMFKMWSIGDELKEFKQEVRLSFNKVKTDFENLN